NVGWRIVLLRVGEKRCSLDVACRRKVIDSEWAEVGHFGTKLQRMWRMHSRLPSDSDYFEAQAACGRLAHGLMAALGLSRRRAGCGPRFPTRGPAFGALAGFGRRRRHVFGLLTRAARHQLLAVAERGLEAGVRLLRAQRDRLVDRGAGVLIV